MKVFIVLCLAVASTCALNLRGSKFVDISPVVPFYKPEARITNGQAAQASQFPYQVGLNLELSSTSNSWCGGSLISNEWVLTAANCTDGISNITVYLGSNIRQAGTRVTASQIIIHPNWNASTLQNDISLLRIPTVSLSNSINIVPLPAVANSYSDYVNQAVIASGWGGSVVSTLQYAVMTVVSNSVCANVYGSSIIFSSNMCTATLLGTSTCNGDSGDPLVLDTTPPTLVGISTFGAQAGCALGYPFVFTRVTSHRKWIQDTTGV